jgi:protein-S-isoprenylcysteine O-methyltransferase Ste14
MDLGFFKGCLKYNAAATIFSVFALYLSMPIFENVNFISNHPIIVSVLFLVLINFLLLIIYWTSNTKKTNSQSGIKGNKITGNKAKTLA